mgnify:CR=1 FL=1
MFELFFELIRCAFGFQGCLSHSPTDDEWQNVFKIANHHALLGICFASLEQLSRQHQQPSQELLYQWIGVARQIEERNKKINKQCLKLQGILKKDGFRSCILKGQGNTLLYRSIDPQLAMLRQPGDIDVWIEGSFDKVTRYVESTCPTDEVNEQHIQFHVFPDTEVEIHYTPTKLANRWKDKSLQQWFIKETDRQMKHSISFDEGEIVMPTVDFNLVYQMLHIYRHFFNEGIGLRQLMDYYVLLHTSKLTREQCDYVRLWVHRFGMERFASALMWILGYVFKMEETEMLWKPDKYNGSFLLSEVMKMGNFGHSDERFQTNGKQSHLKRYWQTVKSKWRFIKYYPSETLWQPIDIFFKFFELRRLKNKVILIRNEQNCD